MLADVVNINEGIPLQEEYGGVKYDCDDGSGNLDTGEYLENRDVLREKAVKYMTEIIGRTEPTNIEAEWNLNRTGATTDFWSREITFGDTTYTMREYTENPHFRGMAFTGINYTPPSGGGTTASGVKTTIDNRYRKASYKIYR